LFARRFMQKFACAFGCAFATAFLLAFVFGAGAVAVAQDEEEEIKEEAKVTITAPRLSQEEKTLAGTVSVLTRRDIERSVAQGLMDLLIREPGIFVARKGQLGFGGNVRVRGLGGDPPTEVLVTVNGHPNFMGIMGHILPAAYLLDNVERIEILRGPASALYGTMGMGGVINIVTKRPTSPREVSGKADFGTYSTRQGETSVGGRDGRWTYMVGWGGRRTDGSHKYAWFKSNNYSALVEREISESLTAKLTIGTTLYSSLDQREIQDKINAGQTPIGLRQNFDRRDYDLTFQWSRNGAPSTMLKLYGARGFHHFQDGYRSRDFVRGVQSQLSVVSGPRLQGVLGVDVQEYGGRIYSPASMARRYERTETAVFTAMKYDAGEKDHIGVGLRWVKPTNFGGSILPQVGYWHEFPNGLTLRMSARRGYRTPSFRELFVFPTSNANLNPERLWQYEVGVNSRNKTGLEIDTALFATRASGLIALGPRSPQVPGLSPVQLRNSPSTTIKGIEVSLRQSLRNGVGGYANFTVLDPGEVRAGNFRRKLSFGVDRVFERLSVYTDLSWVSGLTGLDAKNRMVKLPSFWVAQMKAVYDLGKGLEAYLVIDNLFNTTYRTDPAYPFPMPGRQVRFGLQTAR